MTNPSSTPADRAVHVLLFDGFADWEPAHALAEVRRYGKRTVRSVGFSTEPVISMGGLRVRPDVELAAVRQADVELLLIPGGDMWQTTEYDRPRLEALVATLLDATVPVAAICGATLALARAGVLNDRRHTSNALTYLERYAPEYGGAAHYVSELAVRDRGVITASGLGAVDFARAILDELSVLSDEHRQMWFDLFKHGTHPALRQ